MNPAEQQRREQIIKMRKQVELGRPATPSMSDADAERIAAATGQLTQEQMVAAALLGKVFQTDVNAIKKSVTDSGIKVADVDMSKVMPSGIIKAATGHVPLTVPAPGPQPVAISTAPASVPPVAPIAALPPAPPITNDQLELDFNRQARYEDIEIALENTRNDIKLLSEKVDKLIQLIENKKKPE